MEINKELKIRVVGVGPMGMSLVQALAQSGFSPIGMDINQANLDLGLAAAKSNLEAMVAKGKMSAAEADQTMARITLTGDLESVRDAEVVIESIFENLEAKKDLFTKLDELVASPQCLLLTNTSALSVTEIASATRRPEMVAGTHFFNPVPYMPLVEVVRAARTSDDTLARVLSLVKLMGKQAVVSADTPAFIVNRILNVLFLEAARLVEEGVASIEEVDTCAKLGLGHVIGPFELVDRLQILRHMRVSMEYMFGTLGDRFRMPVWVRNYLVAGRPFYEEKES